MKAIVWVILEHYEDSTYVMVCASEELALREKKKLENERLGVRVVVREISVITR